MRQPANDRYVSPSVDTGSVVSTVRDAGGRVRVGASVGVGTGTVCVLGWPDWVVVVLVVLVVALTNGVVSAPSCTSAVPLSAPVAVPVPVPVPVAVAVVGG